MTENICASDRAENMQVFEDVEINFLRNYNTFSFMTYNKRKYRKLVNCSIRR
jgi:hypothetical protein